jgi:hypothetical protein
MVKDGDIQHILSVNNIEIAAENLITAALNAGGTDNITAALVKIEESAHVKSTFSHFNPIPKPDFVSTQQVGVKKSSVPAKDNKKWLLIGGAMLAVMLSFGLYLKFSGSEKLEPKVGLENDIITKQNIEDCPKLNQLDLLDKKVSDVANEIIVIKDSGDSAVVKDSFVVEIIEKIDRKATDKNSDDDNENEKKTKEEKAKSETQKIEKVNTENQRILKKHTVTSGQGLKAIVDKYKGNCPKLSVESLIEHNRNSPNFKGDKGKLEREELIKGWILEIPCD